MFIVHFKKLFLAIGAIILGLSVISIAVFGLKLSIDFTGGTLIEASYTTRPAKTAVSDALTNLAIGSFSIRPSGDTEYIIRTRDLSPQERSDLESALTVSEDNPVTINRITTIGPTLGSELLRKAILALVVLSLAIVLYIAYVFRKVSKPVPSFVYGLIVVVALLHDIIIPAGFVALLGNFFGAEADVLFVVALLAILGYSVNDTIVVFDRIRENLRDNTEKNMKEDFEITVGKSLQQTYARSINTSLTTALTLLALFFLGAPVTENFALTLIVGIIAGTYSSMFLAAPLLVVLQQKFFKKKR